MAAGPLRAACAASLAVTVCAVGLVQVADHAGQPLGDVVREELCKTPGRSLVDCDEPHRVRFACQSSPRATPVSSSSPDASASRVAVTEESAPEREPATRPNSTAEAGPVRAGNATFTVTHASAPCTPLRAAPPNEPASTASRETPPATGAP